ncbi:unnamed protein product, partial [Discosporangium mesarthrocarpum]
EVAQAVLEGARARAFPTRVVLPANAEFHEAILFVKPLEPGEIVLRGVVLEVLSLSTTCLVDKWGRALQSSPCISGPWGYKNLRGMFRKERARHLRRNSSSMSMVMPKNQGNDPGPYGEGVRVPQGQNQEATKGSEGSREGFGQQANREELLLGEPGPSPEGHRQDGNGGMATATVAAALGAVPAASPGFQR